MIILDLLDGKLSCEEQDKYILRREIFVGFEKCPHPNTPKIVKTNCFLFMQFLNTKSRKIFAILSNAELAEFYPLKFKIFSEIAVCRKSAKH